MWAVSVVQAWRLALRYEYTGSTKCYDQTSQSHGHHARHTCVVIASISGKAYRISAAAPSPLLCEHATTPFESRPQFSLERNAPVERERSAALRPANENGT